MNNPSSQSMLQFVETLAKIGRCGDVVERFCSLTRVLYECAPNTPVSDAMLVTKGLLLDSIMYNGVEFPIEPRGILERVVR